MAPLQDTVTSKDGTRIAFERSGAGPVVVLVVVDLFAQRAEREARTAVAPAAG